jgi:hypothetical protein
MTDQRKMTRRRDEDKAAFGVAQALLAFLALRLLTWAALLPPWGGFDELAHHGLVETCAARFGWPRFEAVRIPPELNASALMAGTSLTGSAATSQHWPLRTEPPPVNYETQQSPFYYLLLGRMLALLPHMAPVVELYVLRFGNALITLSIALISLRSARLCGFTATTYWLPVAWMAFIPGFVIAFERVSNDALCALLVTAGLGAIVSTPGRNVARDQVTVWSAGTACWVKLYGVVTLPLAALHWILRRRGQYRIVLLILLFSPVGLLAFFNWRVNGTVVPLQENLLPTGRVGLWEVPWVRDIWTVAKTQVWVSGSTAIVFPTGCYVAAIVFLSTIAVIGIWTALLARNEALRYAVVMSLGGLAFFGVEQAYHAVRNFAANRASGGSGGWYLWSLALAEGILLSAAFEARLKLRRYLIPLFSIFFGLTICGDAAVIMDAGGHLLTTPGNRHICGVAVTSLTAAVNDFLRVRPKFIGPSGLVLAFLSWCLGALALMNMANRPER